jgi:outer membrane protein
VTTRSARTAVRWVIVLAVALTLLAGARAQADPGSAASTAGADAGPVASAAETAQVAALLSGLRDHPALRASAALAEAAALRADAVRSPFALTAQVDLRRLVVEPATAPLPPPFDDLFAVDASSEAVTLQLLLRPFLVGDLADLGDQRGLETERAVLQARETRAVLEAQAVRAALGVWLGDLAVQLAEDGLALAELAESGSRRRALVGGASAVDVGRAELARREAAAGVQDARRQRDLAVARSASLTGDARLDGPFELTPVVGVPPDLVRAALDVALAEIGARSAGRGLLPTVQAGYSWLLDDGASVTLGLESRTLQPAVSFASGGGGAGGGGLPSFVPESVAPTVRGAFSIGIAWTLSPQAYLESDAVQRQLEAAAAGLAVAHDQARLNQRALEAALATSSMRIELAAFDLELATLERDAADARFAAGAASEIERLQAHLAWRQAVLAHARARLDHLGAVLDTFAAYAIPLSEVLP